MKRKIFIIYDKKNDCDFINGIRGNINDYNISIDLLDDSLKNNTYNFNDSYTKDFIHKKIKESVAVVCIVGKNTHSLELVKYEVEIASQLNKDIYFMRRKGDHTSKMPTDVLNDNTIMDWDIDFFSKF